MAVADPLGRITGPGQACLDRRAVAGRLSLWEAEEAETTLDHPTTLVVIKEVANMVEEGAITEEEEEVTEAEIPVPHGSKTTEEATGTSLRLLVDRPRLQAQAGEVLLRPHQAWVDPHPRHPRGLALRVAAVGATLHLPTI